MHTQLAIILVLSIATFTVAEEWKTHVLPGAGALSALSGHGLFTAHIDEGKLSVARAGCGSAHLGPDAARVLAADWADGVPMVLFATEGGVQIARVSTEIQNGLLVHMVVVWSHEPERDVSAGALSCDGAACLVVLRGSDPEGVARERLLFFAPFDPVVGLEGSADPVFSSMHDWRGIPAINRLTEGWETFSRVFIAAEGRNRQRCEYERIMVTGDATFVSRISYSHADCRADPAFVTGADGDKIVVSFPTVFFSHVGGVKTLVSTEESVHVAFLDGWVAFAPGKNDGEISICALDIGTGELTSCAPFLVPGEVVGILSPEIDTPSDLGMVGLALADGHLAHNTVSRCPQTFLTVQETFVIDADIAADLLVAADTTIVVETDVRVDGDVVIEGRVSLSGTLDVAGELSLPGEIEVSEELEAQLWTTGIVVANYNETDGVLPSLLVSESGDQLCATPQFADGQLVIVGGCPELWAVVAVSIFGVCAIVFGAVVWKVGPKKLFPFRRGNMPDEQPDLS